MPKIEDHHIAAAQLAINRQVEHGQVAAPPLDHRPEFKSARCALAVAEVSAPMSLPLFPGVQLVAANEIFLIVWSRRPPWLLRPRDLRSSRRPSSWGKLCQGRRLPDDTLTPARAGLCRE